MRAKAEAGPRRLWRRVHVVAPETVRTACRPVLPVAIAALLAAFVLVPAGHALHGTLWPELISGASAAEPLRPDRAVLMVLANIGAAAVFAWCCASLLVGRSVRRLMAAVGRWEAGDYAARSGIAGRAWGIGRLGRAFDRMAAALEERERRREADRRVEAWRRAVLETVTDAVVVIDEAGVIRSCNPATGRIFGYGTGELEGRDISLLLPAGMPEGGAEPVEAEGRRRDGAIVPVDLSVSEWHGGEETERFRTAVLREAARRRTEAALCAALDEAEKASCAKSRLLAAASHDLRQPIQSLLLLAAALDDRLKGHPAAGIVDNMRQALEAQRLMLDGLLDISRLDAGVVQPKIGAFSAGALLERLGREYGVLAQGKGVRLDVVRSSAWVRSDEAFLERILRNLVENALRYTPSGRILMGCKLRGGLLAISILDTGIGIPPGQEAAIFEEFHQAGGEVGRREAERGQGLGLGLAIVRRLALLLGHEVRVRSVIGRGSAFTVEVPLAEPGTARRVTQADMRDDGKGLALVIDDEAIILDGMRLLLEGWGYGVIAADSSATALAILAETGARPDVILSDYRLREGGTGTEAIRRIREFCGAKVPGILLTGDTAPERTAEARRDGFMLIHKPLAPDDLRRLMREVCA